MNFAMSRMLFPIVKFAIKPPENLYYPIMAPDKKPEKSLLGHLLDASSVGIQLVISTFAGLAIGYGLDRLFGTSPWLTIFFLVIGIISGFRELLKIARKAEKWDNDDDSKSSR